MKKNISLLMLAISITGTVIAQQEPALSNTGKTFEVPADGLQRRFTVDLGKGNKMQIELSDIADLDRFSNIDSLLRIFLQDIIPLKDSLADELSSKRIDYITDEQGRKKIRIQIFKPTGSSFLLQAGDVAALKLEQDTVNFMGTKLYTERSTMLKPFSEIRYYRLSFFVNQLSNLNNYAVAGLNEKIDAIKKNEKARWIKDKEGHWHIKNGDQAIYANHQPRGYIAGTGDYLTSRWSVNIQNYKNIFVPSISLGAAVIFNNGNIKRDIGLFWEPNFFFAKNADGKLQTFRNDFITLTYGQAKVKKNSWAKDVSYLNIFSLSYLVKQKGNYFEKNTFRVGAGQVSLFSGKIKIEPVFYFNNFLKGLTPGLRLLANF
ncbi:MAG: hypothetical protein ABIO79_12100 [Ferruginibacter sp.]